MHDQIKNILPKEKEFDVQGDGEYHYSENEKVIAYNMAIQMVHAKIPEIIECVYADLRNEIKLQLEEGLLQTYKTGHHASEVFIRKEDILALLTPNQDKS
jgi:hypothetical protein